MANTSGLRVSDIGNPARSSGLDAFLRDLAAPMVERITRRAVATQVATTMSGLDNGVRLPVVGNDASASWTREGDEIAASAPELSTVRVRVGKLAGLVPVTGEANRSGQVDLLQLAGRSLVRDMSARLDEAFFGKAADPAPQGIESLGDAVTTITAGTADNLDAVVSAAATLLDRGHEASAVAVSPGTLARLATVKRAAGSNESLLGPDASLGGALDAAGADGGNAGRKLLGMDLYVSRFVPADQLIVLDRTRTFVVMTGDPHLDASEHAQFSSDTVLVRALQGIGFGFTAPDSIVRVKLPAAKA